MTAAPARAAVLHVQQLPDETWVGNAAWGARTLTDGGASDQLVVQRLAARLAAIADPGPPASVKIVRVPRGGQREEREVELTTLLS